MFETAMDFMLSFVLLASQLYNHVVISNYVEESNWTICDFVQMLWNSTLA